MNADIETNEGDQTSNAGRTGVNKMNVSCGSCAQDLMEQDYNSQQKLKN